MSSLRCSAPERVANARWCNSIFFDCSVQPSEVDWTLRTCYLASMLPRPPQSLGFILPGSPEIICVYGIDCYYGDLTPYGLSSLKLTSPTHRICLNASNDCTITYMAAAWNNS
ncbi:hypothetical protein TNCV_2117681 [Trichonephila clavipes]|nr:hypothetical protein TNCV_2117681 [Trichonephila clavipes]